MTLSTFLPFNSSFSKTLIRQCDLIRFVYFPSNFSSSTKTLTRHPWRHSLFYLPPHRNTQGSWSAILLAFQLLNFQKKTRAAAVVWSASSPFNSSFSWQNWRKRPAWSGRDCQLWKLEIHFVLRSLTLVQRDMRLMFQNAVLRLKLEAYYGFHLETAYTLGVVARLNRTNISLATLLFIAKRIISFILRRAIVTSKISACHTHVHCTVITQRFTWDGEREREREKKYKSNNVGFVSLQPIPEIWST